MDKAKELEAAIAQGIISHSRAARFGDPNRVDVYQYDKESPTGVRHFMSLYPEDAEAMALLRRGLSPLSPTERR